MESLVKSFAVGATLAVVVAAPASLLAAGRGADAAAAAKRHFADNSRAYGLTDANSELSVRKQNRDAAGNTHVRFDQFYKGVKVFEGEVIAHVDKTGRVTVTNALRADNRLDVTPKVAQADAVATALATLDTYGRVDVRLAELQVLPRGERSDADRLVWHVIAGLENDVDAPGQFDVFVDALTGGVVWSFDSLETSAAIGTGNTMYSGI
jgi:Zn-dependent metalloprotease